MAIATFIHDGDSIDYSPPADIAAGAVVVQGHLVGVARADIPAGRLGSLAVVGVFDVVKAAEAFAVGSAVYWDPVNEVATGQAGERPIMGRCVESAAESDPTVRVWLCGGEQEQDPSGSLVLTGATGVTAITPRWDFTQGTVSYSIDGSEPVALTSGVEANIALSPGQVITFTATLWDAVTRIEFASDKVSADLTSFRFPAAMQYFIINSTSVSGSVANWVFNPALQVMAINNTSLSGSVAGWVLPSGFVYLTAQYTNIEGSVGGWVLPSVMTTLILNNTAVGGSVGNWVLPAALLKLYLQDTAVEGNVTGWVIPPAIQEFILSRTAVTGSITHWVLPNTITTFAVNGTVLTGDVGQWANIPPAAVTFNLSATQVYGDINHWTLPSTLSYISFSDTGVEVDVSGWTLPSPLTIMSLSAPGIEGDISGFVLPSGCWYFSCYNNATYGNISGWTLPAVMKTLYLHGTGVDYDSSGGAFVGLTSALEKIDLDHCSLTQAQVDNVLADCVASGVTGKQLDLGDNNAAPSAQGLADKDTLVARGWAVKVAA